MGESIHMFGRSAADRNSRAFQNFANEVLKDGLPRGRMFDFGNLNRVVLREHKKRGIPLNSEKILLRDNSVLKYISHGKEGKLPPNEYYKLDKLIKKPTHIYVDRSNDGVNDTKKRNKKDGFIIVYTTRYSSGKILKSVIETNYNDKRMKNRLKSVGIVSKDEMSVLNKDKKHQYKKIK